MSGWRAALVISGTLVTLPPVEAHDFRGPAAGDLVEVQVAVDGRYAPLYPAADASGRLYLEARAGSSYDVRLVNRSGERLGVVLVVDGLNAISGERTNAASASNRMYVLGPWDDTTVRGWRSSLSEVRRFTFVDERSSYAARSGKASGKLGWIEVAVFRERYQARPWWAEPWLSRERDDEVRKSAPRDRAERATPAPPASVAPEAEDRATAKGRAGEAYGGPAQSYPGTGWGNSSYDPAQLVHFAPEARPAELVTLRYEYASGLRALGIYPRPHWGRDRLDERERGELGFAPAPRW